jgi:NAD(P)-dependent dehydrogenase (short-subunit alcohol dehydrogenase family)
MTKTAQVAIARGLAQLCKNTRVRGMCHFNSLVVNTVLPGPTITDGVREYLKAFQKDGMTMEQVEAEYVRKQEPTSLIGRFVQPNEVANVVAFISSDMASAVNGATQRVEGGILREL